MAFIVLPGAVLLAVAQFRAAQGKNDLAGWPFVRSPRRDLRFAMAGLYALIAVLVLASVVVAAT